VFSKNFSRNLVLGGGGGGGYKTLKKKTHKKKMETKKNGKRHKSKPTNPFPNRFRVFLKKKKNICSSAT